MLTVILSFFPLANFQTLYGWFEQLNHEVPWHGFFLLLLLEFYLVECWVFLYLKKNILECFF
jgi:hypothetical protein